MSSRTVVKLTFKQTGKVHYYARISHIYNHFSSEQIGAVCGSVWNAFNKVGRYENLAVTIERLSVVESVLDGDTYHPFALEK